MRFEKLDLNLLVALDSLLETQSVTESAKQLNLSQPTISAALRRLRQYFDDELLIQVGRTMIPTPKALALAPAVTEMLNVARFRIMQSEKFDCAASNRCFRIIASDYFFDVVLAGVMASLSQIAPRIEFDISPIGPEAVRQFEKGNIDLMITIDAYVTDLHPSKALFRDDDVVVCWKKGAYAKGVTLKQFKHAKFSVASFGEERRPSASEMQLSAMGFLNNIAVRVASFSGLPASVVGTDRLAVMHRKHAEFFKTLYPIVLHDLPMDAPGVLQVAQWHRLRESDSAILWLLDNLEAAAAAL